MTIGVGARRCRRVATLVAAATLLVACGGDGPGRDDRAESTTTAPRTRSTPPSTDRPPTTFPIPPDAPVVASDDAVLRPVADPRSFAFTADTCGASADPSALRCEVAERGEVRLAARIGRAPGGSTIVTVARVQGGRATPTLRYAPALDAREEVELVVGDVDGRPGEEIVVGVRSPGSGSILEVDVIGGTGEVLFHRDLEQGGARLVPGGLEDAAARYGPDDPNCCPSSFTVSVVAFDGVRWRVASTRTVEPTAVPPSDF